MGTWLSLWLPYGIPGSQAKSRPSLCKSCFGIGSQAFQILWLSSWAHGYPYGPHIEFLEANPRANQASRMFALELEARPSTISGLAFGYMAIFMDPTWQARKSSQEAIKPLEVMPWIWKPGLPKTVA